MELTLEPGIYCRSTRFRSLDISEIDTYLDQKSNIAPNSSVIVNNILLRYQDLTAIRYSAKSDLPVVIMGETGTGKEEVAKLIHKAITLKSPRPFVSTNCANLDGELAGSTLFGHRKGAFTGAENSSKGLIGEADGGILFLDEIHYLSLENQQRLLRVLNDGSYMRLGDVKESRSSFKIIVASTKDLDEEVNRGRFLLDLRSRLIGVDIHLPPLRERHAELTAFIELYFKKRPQAAKKIPQSELPLLIKHCQNYYWQGNIRQLFKVLDSLFTKAEIENRSIKAIEMPIFKTMLAPKHNTGCENEALTDAIDYLHLAYQKDIPLNQSLSFFEKFIIESTLKRHRKISSAHEALCISRTQFHMKRAKYRMVN